jgi:hypothetical protein
MPSRPALPSGLSNVPDPNPGGHRKLLIEQFSQAFGLCPHAIEAVGVSRREGSPGYFSPPGWAGLPFTVVPPSRTKIIGFHLERMVRIGYLLIITVQIMAKAQSLIIFRKYGF